MIHLIFCVPLDSQGNGSNMSEEGGLIVIGVDPLSTATWVCLWLRDTK